MNKQTSVQYGPQDGIETTTTINKTPKDNTQPEHPFRVPSDFSRDELILAMSKRRTSTRPIDIPTALLMLAEIKRISDFKGWFYKGIEGPVYAEISNKTLQSTISTRPRDLFPIISVMEEIGWIEIDDTHEVGVKSMGYRIGRRFQNSHWIKMPWEQALKTYFPEVFEPTALGKKKKIYLQRWHRVCSKEVSWKGMKEGPLKQVCLQTDRILRHLEIFKYDELVSRIKNGEFYNYEKKLAAKKGKEPITMEESIRIDLEMIQRVKEKRYILSCHDERKPLFTNRLFTNWTNMKKEFRPYFRLKGRPMSGVDIKACQAALLASFYSDSPDDVTEKAKFVEVVTKLDMYQELADMIAQMNGGCLITRKEAKNKSFSLMFGQVRQEDRDIRAAFESMFPVLYRRMVEQKAHGYKTVARKMQLKESGIMIEGVLHELLVEKGIDCLSVHDSIYCHEENIAAVKDSITTWFSSKMGFAPQLVVEGLKEPEYSSPTLWFETPGWWSALRASMTA